MATPLHMDRETNPGFVLFARFDKRAKKMPPQVIIAHGRHMVRLRQDLFWQIYRKNVLLRSYLDSRYGGKESTEVTTIEKFLFSKSGAL
jgi:hypothetical protein